MRFKERTRRNTSFVSTRPIPASRSTPSRSETAASRNSIGFRSAHGSDGPQGLLRAHLDGAREAPGRRGETLARGVGARVRFLLEVHAAHLRPYYRRGALLDARGHPGQEVRAGGGGGDQTALRDAREDAGPGSRGGRHHPLGARGVRGSRQDARVPGSERSGRKPHPSHRRADPDPRLHARAAPPRAVASDPAAPREEAAQRGLVLARYFKMANRPLTASSEVSMRYK